MVFKHKMKKKIFTLVYTTFIVLLFSYCSNNSEPVVPEIPTAVDFKTYVLDSVISFQQNKLRGVALGESRNNILNLELTKPTDQDGDFLLYEIKSHPQINFAVVYTFVNDSLDEMEIRIDSDVADLNVDIFSTLKTGLTKNLSEPNEDKGIVVFETKDAFGKKCYVSISDNSSIGHSNINLLYYKEK